MRKHRRYLEGAHEPPAGDIGRRRARNLIAPIENMPVRRVKKLGQKIETRRLAGAVRADQRVNGSAAHRQVHAVDSEEPLEFLGEPGCPQNEIIRHRFIPNFWLTMLSMRKNVIPD